MLFYIIRFKMILKKQRKVVEKLLIHLLKAKQSIHTSSLNCQDQSAQEAEVAMHYMMEISKSNQDKPLIERLFDLKVDTVDHGVFEKKRRLFVGGIPIDTIVFNQQRVLNAIGEGSQLFCFYPTTMVTEPIFNHLNQKNKSKSMIFGPFGISKTTSIILYHQLSSDVNKYMYLTSQQNRQLFKARWAEKGAKIPNKLFYWSVKLGEPQQQTVEILRRQCPELNLSESIAKLPQIVSQIHKYYYNKKMPCNVVIDQINKIAAVFRDYNTFILNKVPKTQEIQLDSKLANKAKKFYNQINNIATWTRGKYFINSSVNIQDSVLGRSKESYKKQEKNEGKNENQKIKQRLLFMDLNDHSDIFKFRIQYIKNMRKEVGQKQIDLIIAKQVINRLPVGTIKQIWKLSPGQMEETILKNEITAIRGEFQWEFYIRPLTIYSVVSRYTFFEAALASKQKMIAELNRFIKLLKDDLKKKLIQKMKQFLTKGFRSSSKQTLALHIYLMALDRVKSEKKRNFIILKEELKYFNPLQDLDQEMFIQQNDFYQIQVSPPEYLEIFKEKEFSAILSNQKLEQLEDFIQNRKNRALFGYLVQQNFNLYLKHHFRGTELRLQKAELKENFIFKGVENFVHFNTMSGKYKTVLSHLDKMIKICKNNKKYSVIGLPISSNSQPSGTSASIDLLFMSIFDKRVEVYTFDFATSKNIQNIKSKLTKKKISLIISQAKEQIDQENMLASLIKLNTNEQPQNMKNNQEIKKNQDAQEEAQEIEDDIDEQYDQEDQDAQDAQEIEEKQKVLEAQKGWGVQQLKWEHFIVVSPQIQDKIGKSSKYLYRWITFNDIHIQRGDSSPERQVFEMGVKLMAQSKGKKIKK